MRTSLAAILLLLSAFAQGQTEVSGSIRDTLGKRSLSLAVVTLTSTKDSTLYQFTRTDKEGKFSFPQVAAGRYRLLVTYPKFADYADEVEVKSTQPIKVGTIPLTLKASLLDAVVIRSAGSIRIKGDTTEFVADSFKVAQGATVEELLKRLPGFTVNSRGEITAQGQRVQKVLVDGEEFFGDDPTAATKNIGAKAVDRVQLFDNKTEQQNLTGISGGSEGKTVNIKLKEDFKKGSFGKAEAGSDFDRIVDARLLYNRFVGKKKFSVYGTRSNTSTGSLNWEDRRKLGIENDVEYDELSGYYYSFGNSDEFNDWSLRGLPSSYTAGGLFIDKWNGEKQAVNTSYRYNRLATTNEGNRFEQNVLPGDVLTIRTRTLSNGLNEQHAVNGKYEWKIDSLSSLKLTLTGLKKNTFAESNLVTESSTANSNKSNRNVVSRFNNGERLQTDNQLQYKQLFKKKNRQLIATLRAGVTSDEQEGLVNANASFLSGANTDSTRLQDQQKMNTGNSLTYGVKASFSEPLSDRLNLVTEYSFNRNESESRRNTFEKTAGSDKYTVRIPFFSNNFKLDATSHSGSLFARYIHKKIRFSVGTGISSIRLNLFNIDSTRTSVYHFRNLTPQASFNYSPKQQSGIGFNYRGTTRQPGIEQLQPIRNNEDQLNIFQGNPNLKVAFNHNINLFYNSFKMLSSRYIFVNGGFNFTEDALSQSTTTFANGSRTYTPVNVDGNNNWYFNGHLEKGEGEKKFIHSVSINSNGGRTHTVVNNRMNRNDYYSVNLGYGIRYEVFEKYRIHLRPNGGYNGSSSSLNPGLQNNYWSYGGEVEGMVTFPGKIELFTECNFDLRQRVAAFGGNNPNIILWNATLSKKVFKNKSGKIMLQANDILDQNRGFTRLINSDRIYEETFQRISQYFMLRFEWSFNLMAGQK